jgi:hypothetical protein
VTEQLEGWCSDPYGRHEARWLSDGHPTKLVRDAGVESYDDPPDEAPTSIPTPLDDPQQADGTQTGDQYDLQKAHQDLKELFRQIPWTTNAR